MIDCMSMDVAWRIRRRRRWARQALAERARLAAFAICKAGAIVVGLVVVFCFARIAGAAAGYFYW